MKRCKIFLASVTLFASSFVFAKSGYVPPFYEVILSAGTSMTVSYNLGRDMQLVCWDSWGAPNSETIWNYKDHLYKNKMPITLKDNAQREGEWANPTGDLKINNNSDDKLMLVSCYYS